MLTLTDLQTGRALPEIRRSVAREDINLYALASGDFNPIHLDAEFASKTPAGGIIAHGMLIMAYVSQMLTEAFAQSWLSSGKLNIRFKAPARPGDLLTVSGKVEKLQPQDGRTLVTCSVLCANQNGEAVITGEAAVSLTNQENAQVNGIATRY
jgi:acyl dehydratase